MSLEVLIQVATLVSLVVAAIGLWWAVWSYRHQMNARIFLTYTERYEKIMSSFPPSAFVARFDLLADLPPPSNELTTCVLKYLNLCSEEYYLYVRGYLSGEVWAIWEAEVRRTLASPLVRREWLHLRHEFFSLAFVEDLHNSTCSAAQGPSAPGRNGEPQRAADADHPVWYFALTQTVARGPFTFVDLARRARQGEFTPSHKVWRVGHRRWIEAELVPGLFGGCERVPTAVGDGQV
jgi:hypothetical protein